MRVSVFLNGSAGSMAGDQGAQILAQVEAEFAKANTEAEVQVVAGESLPGAVKRAAASDVAAVVVGGGDGTINIGAAALVGGSKPLGVIPLGTLNHFAKDAGIPLDLTQAVATIAAGHVIDVDVGEVNGAIFLNNSSIGLYPLAVHQRDELRHLHGGGKMSAMFNAGLDVLRRFPLLDVTLEAGDAPLTLRVPFIFVGNNRYEMSLFALGKRTSLQGGELGIYLTKTTDRLGVLRLAFRALIGRMKQDRDFHYLTNQNAEIRTRRRTVRVSLDGEVRQMTSPIRYSTRPRALRLLLPRPIGSETTA